MALLGTIIGDTVGKRFEWNSTKDKNFEPLITDESSFTDDTLLTIATADCILHDPTLNYTKYYQQWGVKYPTVGFGGTFMEWIYLDDPRPYNSWGNGSAMRVAPVGWAYDNLEDVLKNAAISANVTHSHVEGLKGAQATASAIFMARKGCTKEDIRLFVSNTFGYNLQRHSDDIRPDYSFHVSCQKSVPESIISFLDSTSFEDCIRIAVSLGGDSDTMAAIAGSIAEPFYKVIPKELGDICVSRMSQEMIDIYNEFNEKYDRK